MRAQTKLQSLVTAAILAAAITIMTAFLFHVPIGATGGYVHFGDALIYLSAALLPAPYAVGPPWWGPSAAVPPRRCRGSGPCWYPCPRQAPGIH